MYMLHATKDQENAQRNSAPTVLPCIVQHSLQQLVKTDTTWLRTTELVSPLLPVVTGPEPELEGEEIVAEAEDVERGEDLVVEEAEDDVVETALDEVAGTKEFFVTYLLLS